MRMQAFTAEASLYRAVGYYGSASVSYVGGFDTVSAAQTLPTCGSGNFTNCAPGTLPNCPTNCVQKCIDPTAPAPRLECCPADKCGGGQTGDCCKKVCCEVKVS